MTVYSQYITLFMKKVIRSAVLMGIVDCAIFNKFSFVLIYFLSIFPYCTFWFIKHITKALTKRFCR